MTIIDYDTLKWGANNPNKGLQAFHAALSNAGNQQCRIMIIGDSVSEGVGATAIANRYPNVMLKQLRKQFQPSTIAGGRGYLPCAWGAFTPIPDPATTSSAGFDAYYFGLAGRSRGLVSGNSYVWSVNGTSVDIVYPGGPAYGSLYYKIDAGANVVIDCNKGVEADYYTTRVSLGTRGAHTVTVGWNAGNPFIDGIVEYDQDENAGIVYFDSAHSGYRTTDFTGVVALTPQIQNINPHLVIIELGGNDAMGGLTSASVRDNLNIIIGKVRAAAPNASIALVGVYSTSAAYPTEPWSSYINKIYNIAKYDTNMGTIDIYSRMPGVGVDTLGLYYDQWHPNDKGHALLGNYVASLISPK